MDEAQNNAAENNQQPEDSVNRNSLKERFLRLTSNISIRLQFAAIILSLVGLGFGVKSYWHVREAFGDVASEPFLVDLYYQVVIAVCVNILVGVAMQISAVHPINVLNETMRQLAAGRLDVTVPYTKVRNQIGSTARKVGLFYDNVKQLKELQTSQERERRQAEEAKRELLERLANEFDMTVHQIAETVVGSAKDIKQSSQSVMDCMQTSKRHVVELRRQSSSATNNVSSIASATEELSTSIKQINSQVSNASKMAESAVKIAESAGETVGGLADGAEKIGSIIDLINEIAEQINLLALNATIEAARAGEAGKGFAVVASEVKSLANQTAKATQEISSYVETIQGETGSAIKFIENISRTIRDINEITVSISSSMEQQGVATQEIARNMQSAVGYANNVEKNVSTVAAVSDDAHNAADELMNVCTILTNQSDSLNDEVAKFVRTVKVA